MIPKNAVSQFEIMTSEPNTIPPYVPHRTFTTFLEFLTPGVPDRIDRSVFASRFSGSAASQISSTLRALGLIDADGKPQEELFRLVSAKGDERRSIKRALLQRYYTPVFQLDLEHATRGQLRQALREFGTTDSMLIKCESFFIHAARDAGVPLSRHILSHRTRASRSRPESKVVKTTALQPTPVPQPGSMPAMSTTIDNEVAALMSLADKVLEKYPSFDPTWSKEAQESWIEGMERLTDRVFSRLGKANEELEGATR